ncbi:MAG: beta-eliminating lyase-related protein, partial [Saprospiraceae bacterium]
GELGPLFDSISICFSKGLGAPIGSVLLGNKEFINESRRIRKVMGGGMRQAGVIAAAGLYALDHNIIRLTEDHQKAKTIEKILLECSYVDSIHPVETNIIIFQLKEEINTFEFVEKLRSKGINSSAFGIKSIRFVTHMDITEEITENINVVLKDMGK